MAMELQGKVSSSSAVPDGKAEVDLYTGNISPVGRDFDNPLGWWKKMQGTLQFMALPMRDILAILGIYRHPRAPSSTSGNTRSTSARSLSSRSSRPPRPPSPLSYHPPSIAWAGPRASLPRPVFSEHAQRHTLGEYGTSLLMVQGM
ncbi:hypothetical protein C8J57DRAFT_1719208 [Mycena rebaudengoi]|nr:hypothetical protein C8J57DRAFT_1719208 [Mycena rebaudengoi]